MSTILEDISNGAAGLAEVKDELAAAISEKGVTVPTDQPLASYPDWVREIPAANGNFVTEEELEAKGFITREDLEALPVGGLAIGSIFAYPSAEPPEGAYLLNGQTIYNCSTLYPDFWDWLTTKVSAGYVRSVTALEYEQDIAEYGFCGAFVISSNDVRLPNYTNAFLMGGDASNNGTEVAAGLPNITGSLQTRTNADSNTGAFTNGIKTTGAYTGTQTSYWASFDASLSNPIYGKSDTVQPPAIRVSWCIQVFNAATELSQQESAQLASQMQMKAQTDLANVTANIDFVVESWSNGNGWYRKYKSGWIEQGGVATSSEEFKPLTFYIPFTTTNYFIAGSYTAAVIGDGSTFNWSSKTTTSIRGRIYTPGASGTVYYQWFACGY